MDKIINGTTVSAPTGWCAEGYYGAFCSACMPGYRAGEGNVCSECASFTVDIMRVIGTFTTVLILLIILVKTTLETGS
jgi:hypothetical protein